MKCKDCTVFGCQYRTTDAEKDCYYEQWTAKEKFNYQSFRAEAAKDILCTMIQGGYGESRIEHQSELAVKYIDELIKKLKEKED